MVKKLTIPDDFNGMIYHDRYGEYPASSEEGLLDVPDHLTQEDIDDCVFTINHFQAQKIERLWKAATDYEYSFVANGAYTALLEAKLSGDTKAIAFGDWIKSLWTEYYSRRDAVTATTNKLELDLISEYFTIMGEPPYTIREILFGE